MITRTLTLVALGAVMLHPLEGSTHPDREPAAIDDLVARAERPPVSYRAFRRLEATSRKMSGWLEAWTEFDPATGFQYQVVGEGGAGRVRNSVLRAILDAEKRSSRPEEARRGAFSLENYQFQAAGYDTHGMMKLLLIPRRRDSRLIDGTLIVNPDRGDLLRLEGQLAKSPSFWVRSVNVSWRYEQVEDVAMPVEVRSEAQVKIVGHSTFVMTYDYAMVDGRCTKS